MQDLNVTRTRQQQNHHKQIIICEGSFGQTWRNLQTTLTLYTLTLYAYSPYCSLHVSNGNGKENLFDNQEVIIPFILVTQMFDS